MDNIYIIIILSFILLFIFKPKNFCNCENFDQNIIRNNCSELTNDNKLIKELLNKSCNINNKNLNDRENLNLINDCRNYTEMEIFNNRESGNWCKSATDKKSTTIQDMYPVNGNIISDENYYTLNYVDQPKDKVLSDLKLDTYTDIKLRNYAYKL